MNADVYYYNGFFIQKDKAGDGYNVFKGFQIFDEGIQSVKQAMEAIDEYKAHREICLPWEE